MATGRKNKTNVVEKKKRLPIFAQRFFELQDGRSNKEMGDFLGVAGATVGYYANGDRLPNAEDLKNICQKCNVSADWLLGLSNARSSDMDVQTISKKTGLSEDSIKGLMFLNEYADYTTIDFLNDLMEHELLDTIAENFRKAKLLIEDTESIIGGFDPVYEGDGSEAGVLAHRRKQEAARREKEKIRNEVSEKVGVTAEILTGWQLLEFYKFTIEKDFDQLLKDVLYGLQGEEGIYNRVKDYLNDPKFYEDISKIEKKNPNFNNIWFASNIIEDE